MFLITRYARLPATEADDYVFDKTMTEAWVWGDPATVLKNGNPVVEERWGEALRNQYAAVIFSVCDGFEYATASTSCTMDAGVETRPVGLKIYLNRIAGENREKRVRGIVTTDMTTDPPSIDVVRLTAPRDQSHQSAE